MNAKHLLRLLPVAGCMWMTTGSTTAAEALSGEVTVKLHAFDFESGYGDSRSSFLERYHTRRDWIQNGRRSGAFMDLDVSLKYQLADDRQITADRWGDGWYRQGGRAAFDTSRLQLSAKYDFLRTATGGLNYLFNPNLVPGGTDPLYYFPAMTNTASGYAAQFNDTSDRMIYNMNRLSYGFGFKLKPGVLGDYTQVSLDWSGYVRQGQRFQNWVFGGGDVIPTTDRALQRWRAMTKRVEENNNRLSLNVQASPGDLFNVAYTGAYEKFDNRARDVVFRDVPFQPPYTVAAANLNRPVGFVPDSTLMTHDLRANKTIGATRLSAGFNLYSLEQDSFSEQQLAVGWDSGKVNTKGAFVNFDTALTDLVALRGFTRYDQRRNKSSYPVAGLIAAAASSSLGVRLNEIESLKYGLSLVTRPKGIRSTVELGWEAEDKSRDLTFNETGIIPSVSLLKGDTRTDQIFVKGSTRLSDRLSLRGGLSYAWADKTGLVTEPAEALGVRTMLIYTVQNGSLFSIYYNLKDTANDNNAFVDKFAANPAVHYQNVETKLQTAGIAYDFKPSSEVEARVSLNWNRHDASVLYYETNRRRYETNVANPILFNLRDISGSKIDVYVFETSAVWNVSTDLSLDAAYYLTLTDGHLASGQIAAELSKIDNTLDSALHTIVMGMSYRLSQTSKLRVTYTYDDYSDNGYPLLSASAHMVVFALTWEL